MSKRKTKQNANTYSTNKETEDKLLKLVLIRSEESGKILGKSAVIRAVIHEAFAAWEQKRPDTSKLQQEGDQTLEVNSTRICGNPLEY